MKTSVTSPVRIGSPAGGHRVSVFGPTGVQGFDLDRDRPLWSLTWPGRLATIPVESDGMLISSTMDGRVTAFRIPQT